MEKNSTKKPNITNRQNLRISLGYLAPRGKESQDYEFMIFDGSGSTLYIRYRGCWSDDDNAWRNGITSASSVANGFGLDEDDIQAEIDNTDWDTKQVFHGRLTYDNWDARDRRPIPQNIRCSDGQNREIAITNWTEL